MAITEATEALRKASLLSDQAEACRRTDHPVWGQLIREAHALMQETLAEAPFSQRTTLDPRTVGTCLMLRSITSFECAAFLAERGAAGSALSLARSCLEDGFVMTLLVEDPQAMIDQLKLDFDKSRAGQIGIVLKQSLAADDVLDELKKIAGTLGKGRFISYEDIAKRSPRDTRYLLYRMLSSHAVHCSADSLQRFVSIEQDKWTAFRFGPEDSERMPSVFRYICMAALPTALEFARLFGLGAYEERLGKLLENAADRDVPKDWFVYP